jgi:hypothetical protein
MVRESKRDFGLRRPQELGFLDFVLKNYERGNRSCMQKPSRHRAIAIAEQSARTARRTQNENKQDIITVNITLKMSTASHTSSFPARTETQKNRCKSAGRKY